MKKLLGIVVMVVSIYLIYLLKETDTPGYNRAGNLWNMSEGMRGPMGVWFGLILFGLMFGAVFLYGVYKDKKIFKKEKRKKIIFWGVVGLIFGACYLYEVYKEINIYNNEEKRTRQIIIPEMKPKKSR